MREPPPCILNAFKSGTNLYNPPQNVLPFFIYYLVQEFWDLCQRLPFGCLYRPSTQCGGFFNFQECQYIWGLRALPLGAYVDLVNILEAKLWARHHSLACSHMLPLKTWRPS